jgi:ferredoxin
VKSDGKIKEEMMKVSVDPELCTGCELCVDIAPDVFEMRDDIAAVKVDTVPEDAEESVQEAVDSCPSEAIAIE